VDTSLSVEEAVLNDKGGGEVDGDEEILFSILKVGDVLPVYI
jgi:hypothetical protein